MSAATMNEMERLRRERDDALVSADNWKANATQWKHDWHELRGERDALAAHVELLDHPATVFIENAQEVIELLESAGDAPNIVAVREDLTKAADELAKILNSAPTSSLARLKSEWQAEGMRKVADLAENSGASQLATSIRQLADAQEGDDGHH